MDFYIIETLYIPVTIINSDHVVEASMVHNNWLIFTIIFKWIILTVFGRWMQDGFSYCYSNSIFWEQILDLPAWQYHYGGREASATHIGDLQLVLLYSTSWGAEEPRKTSHMYLACSSLSLSLSLSVRKSDETTASMVVAALMKY